MKNWTHAYDDNHHSPYAFDEDQWVGYDNVQSIYRKAQFINRYNLGGSMVFSLDADDFRGFCKGGKYPLLNALNKGLNGVRYSLV
jgi:chitinase